MTRAVARGGAAALERLTKRVAAWRVRREHPGSRVPEELWNEAVLVARIRGVYPTAKAIGFDDCALEARVDSAAEIECAQTTFVEVHMPAAQQLGQRGDRLHERADDAMTVAGPQVTRCGRPAHARDGLALREHQVYHARLLPAHFARLRLGLRCVLKTKRRVPRAPRPNARLANAQIADARGTVEILADGVNVSEVMVLRDERLDQGFVGRALDLTDLDSSDLRQTGLQGSGLDIDELDDFVPPGPGRLAPGWWQLAVTGAVKLQQQPRHSTVATYAVGLSPVPGLTDLDRQTTTADAGVVSERLADAADLIGRTEVADRQSKCVHTTVAHVQTQAGERMFLRYTIESTRCFELRGRLFELLTHCVTGASPVMVRDEFLNWDPLRLLGIGAEWFRRLLYLRIRDSRFDEWLLQILERLCHEALCLRWVHHCEALTAETALLSLLASVALFGLINEYWACVAVSIGFLFHTVAGMWVVRQVDNISMSDFVRACVPPLLACIPMVGAVLDTRWPWHSFGVDVLGLGVCLEVLAGAVACVPAALVMARGTSRDLLVLVRAQVRRRRGDGRTAEPPSPPVSRHSSAPHAWVLKLPNHPARRGWTFLSRHDAPLDEGRGHATHWCNAQTCYAVEAMSIMAVCGRYRRLGGHNAHRCLLRRR